MDDWCRRRRGSASELCMHSLTHSQSNWRRISWLDAWESMMGIAKRLSNTEHSPVIESSASTETVRTEEAMKSRRGKKWSQGQVEATSEIKEEERMWEVSREVWWISQKELNLLRILIWNPCLHLPREITCDTICMKIEGWCVGPRREWRARNREGFPGRVKMFNAGINRKRRVKGLEEK